jgi:hypothetical protein
MLNNRLNPTLFASIAIVVASILIILISSSVSYAQTPPPPNSSGGGAGGGMKKQTSGGALDIVLQASPQPVGHTSPTSLKVEFMTKGTGAIQPHIDYDVVIKDSSGGGGKQVFTASQLAGQPGKPLHTAEGIVTIPYTFPAAGDYSISIPVYGILFNPIKPESADFTIKVT